MTSLTQGFAVIEDCCSATECDAAIARLAPLSGAGTRCLLDEAWCQTLATELRRRVAAVLPEVAELVAVQCTFFDKSPERNWLVALHQDRSVPVGTLDAGREWTGLSTKEGMTFVQGPDELLAQMVALRLHLDDSSSENGPLRVIPNSHLSGALSSDEIAAFRESTAERSLTVKKGAVIAMRPLLLHASGKSLSAESRRVLHFLLGPSAPTCGLTWRRAV